MRTKEEIKKEIYSRVKEYYDSYLSSRGEAIPVSGKKYDEKELISIVDAALEGWWTEGKVTLEFEEKFKKFLGVSNAIVVNSGSSANLLAFKALMSSKIKERRIELGDEIITVAASFPTTVNPIIQAGCIPVFCDAELGTYNIRISDMKKALSSKTKAVMIAHTLGNPFNVKEVSEFCRKNKLWLIEDSCDALGATYDGKNVGTFGDIATFSFYPAHHITMGEGGAVVTNNPNLARIIRSIRDWGRDCWCMTGHDNTCGKRYAWKLGDLPFGYDHKYIYSEIGYNLKNTDLNVAIGVAQMDKLPSFISARRKNFEELLDKMKKFEKYFYLPVAEPNSEPSWFGFLLTVKEDAGFTREDLLKFLEKEKIGTRLLFGGNITKQPYFIDNKIKHRIIGDLKNTDIIMKNTFWIGVCPLIEKKDIEKMSEAFERFLKR